MVGMMLHIDGSKHRWFGDDRWYALIVIMDDASSEIYYAQLVEEESTLTVMAGLRAVVERKGVFCSLYSDRASHFFVTPKAGEAGESLILQGKMKMVVASSEVWFHCSPSPHGVSFPKALITGIRKP